MRANPNLHYIDNNIRKRQYISTYKIEYEYDIASKMCVAPIYIIPYYRRQYWVKWKVIQAIH